MKEIKKRIVSICLALCLFMSGWMNLIQAEAAANPGTVYVDRQADVVFVIDATGSMQPVINGVKKNLTDFITSLKEDDVDVRVRFSIYRDTTVASDDPTTVTNWFTDPADAIAELNKIKASGGGDGPETILDGYGDALTDKDAFRDKAAKFFVALTDANYKVNDADGYTVDGIIDEMEKKSINSSVVTRGSWFTEYGKFLSKPSTDDGDDGGILADIEGDYSILLKDLAQKVITVIDDTQAVKISANMIVLKKKNNTQMFSRNKKDPDDPDSTTDPQSSCVFKDLTPDTDYTFTVTDGKAATRTFTLRTEKATGAQMGKIPNIVYEGETYQIRPNENMKMMLATPGSKIHWSTASADCLKVVDNEIGNGCDMKVYDCKYNENRLIKTTLIADIEYTVWQKNGTYKMKSARFKQSFNIKNDIDAMDIVEEGGFHGTADNQMIDGIIRLLTTDKVWLDVKFNQGDAGDIASKQKLKYFISDKYGNENPNGKRIAKVNSRGQITGVAPGVTYLTIASSDSYNKYSKMYGYFITIPIVCPAITDANFDMKKAVTDKRVVLIPGDKEVYAVKKGETLDLKECMSYGPEEIFNKDKMKCNWSSTNKTVATVSNTGNIRFKDEGYVTVLMTPTGGYEVDSETGKRIGSSQPCSVTFKVVEEITDDMSGEATETTPDPDATP